MQIKIIYEDDDIIVIDKPAGVIVNRSDTTRNEVTVQDWAENYLGVAKVSAVSKVSKENGDDPFNNFDAFYQRGGVVHRLDKETSGVLILAKNPEAFITLLDQFRERTVKKVYVALAHGKIMPEEGEINVPVGRLPWNRNHFGILPGGRESKTLYKVLRYYTNPQNKEVLSYVELYPQSGRTHQIRVHLKYIHHPIFSDFLYAGRKTARNDRKVLERVFLHAAKITLIHPVTKKILSFEAVLPPELHEVIQKFT